MPHLASYILPEQLDPHCWDLERSAPCTLYVDGRVCGVEHGMVCSRCGIRRFGPFRGRGIDHFFTYEHPDGLRHELMPPCSVQSVRPEVEIREVMVCANCRGIIMNPKFGCRIGCNAGVRMLRACVLLSLSGSEAICALP